MKKKHFLLPLLMAIVMMAMCPMKMWADDLTPLTADKCTELGLDAETYTGYYAIGSASDLTWFRDKANQAYNDFKKSNAVLTADIDMSSICHAANTTTGVEELNWVPITSFYGIFDGNNKTISNLYINAPDGKYQALFGHAYEEAQIKNLTVRGNVTAKEYTALILAVANDRVKLTNCKSEGSVTGSKIYIAGIVAYFDGDEDNMPTISGCKNVATVTSNYDENAYAGGIAGYAEDIIISKCTNEATVTAAGLNVGGISGFIDANDSSKPSSISECTNTGAITSTHDGYVFAGGIVGKAYDVNLSKCTNEATVTASANVGGIAGYICAEDSSYPLSISECTNIGAITSTYYDSAFTGGIAGEAVDTNISKCTNEATVTAAGSNVGGIVGWAEKSFSVSECKNTGNVTSNCDGYFANVGGIIGYYWNDSNVLILSQCYNTGKISGTALYVGGLAGSIYTTNSGSSIKDCYTTGDVISTTTKQYAYVGGAFGELTCPTVSNVYSAATITKTNIATDYVGAFAGSTSNSTLTNCYYDSDKTELVFNGYVYSSTIDASVNGGKSTAAFASGEVAYLLNGSRSEGTTESPLVWYQGIGADAYPTLDQNEYTIVKYDATDGYYNDIENIASIEIQDGEAYDAKLKRTTDQLTYKRTFANITYNALYVPFAMSYSDWSEKADVYRLLNIFEEDEDDNGTIDKWVLKVVKLKDGESTKANTPYIIKPKESGEMTLTLSDVLLAPAEEKSIWCASTDYKFVFKGSYAEKAIAADSYFFMSTTGGLQYSNEAETLKPQRWYMGIYNKDTDALVAPSTFNTTANNVKGIRISVEGDDEATGIADIDDNDNVNNGKRLENGRIVILKNGKKYNTSGQQIK